MEQSQLRKSQEQKKKIEAHEVLTYKKGNLNKQACDIFTKGIMLRTNHKDPKYFFDNSQEDLIKIFFLNKQNIKNDEFSHLLDSNGNLNLRNHKSEKIKILIFKKNTDVESICKKASKKIKELKIKYISIVVYKGNPLDSRKNHSRLIVHNPYPFADKEYYSDFGDVEEVRRIHGVDNVIFKTLFTFLPVIEEHAKWKKNLNNRKFFFFLEPNEDNLAAPSYCLLKKNYTPNEDYQYILNQLKEKYPKKEVKVVRKTNEPKQVVVPNTPATIDLIATPNKSPKKKKNKTDTSDTPKSTGQKKKKKNKDILNNSKVISYDDSFPADASVDENLSIFADSSDSDTKKKKNKTQVLTCIHIKSNNEQCKSKPAKGSDYCGTHNKKTPKKNKK